MYYSASDDVRLYIGTSTASVLPAPGLDTFTEVPLLRRLQQPPVEQTAASFRVLNDNNPRSIGGRQVDQEYTGAIAIDRALVIGQNMKADAGTSGGRKRNWRVVYADGTIENFRGFVTRYAPTQLDAEQEPAPHEAEFTIRVDGGISES